MMQRNNSHTSPAAMTSISTPRWRILLILPPIMIGVAVLMMAKGGKQAPPKVEKRETARVVRVVEAPTVRFAPAATGFGEARPAQVWTAVAQVSGRVSTLHPRLRNGEILAAGTELFRIDPVDYELKLAQARAERAQLDVTRANTEASLAIEKRNLRVAERELARIRKLAKQGTASKSNADAAERTMLSTRTAMQNMKNSLSLLPTQRAVAEAQVTQAERDLANTRVNAPFNLRVANLQVEQDQYVSVGQSLFQGDAVDRVEVQAQFAMAALRRMFLGRDLGNGDVRQLNENLPAAVRFQATVRLDMGNHTAEWDAEFLRFSDDVDADTRTIGVVVSVDKPWDQVIPGVRPPLSKGMYVEVELRGPAGEARRVIPRDAVRNGAILIADGENRLRRRPVRPLYTQGALAVLPMDDGPGDDKDWRVVVSDLIPAVEGMLLEPQIDAALNDRLAAAGQAQPARAGTEPAR